MKDDNDYREITEDTPETEVTGTEEKDTDEIIEVIDEDDVSESDASGDDEVGKTDDTSDKSESDREDVCFICRRPESKAGKMFHLMQGICVCADCMNKTMNTVSGFDYQGMLNNPNISFMNISDLNGEGGIPNKQKLKKRKKGEKPRLRWMNTWSARNTPKRL